MEVLVGDTEAKQLHGITEHAQSIHTIWWEGTPACIDNHILTTEFSYHGYTHGTLDFHY